MQNPWKMPDYYGLMISSNKHTILFGNDYDHLYWCEIAIMSLVSLV